MKRYFDVQAFLCLACNTVLLFLTLLINSAASQLGVFFCFAGLWVLMTNQALSLLPSFLTLFITGLLWDALHPLYPFGTGALLLLFCAAILRTSQYLFRNQTDLTKRLTAVLLNALIMLLASCFEYFRSTVIDSPFSFELWIDIALSTALVFTLYPWYEALVRSLFTLTGYRWGSRLDVRVVIR